MTDYNSLSNHYRMMFILRQEHRYNDEYMDKWIPYERDFYVEMLIKHLKDKEERQRRAAAAQ